MSFDRHSVPLPLALHLASYSVVGLFCGFAGGLNLIDPGHIITGGVPLLIWSGFSIGYVFGILMGRTEVILFGWVSSLLYVVGGYFFWTRGFWKFGADWRLGALCLALGLIGFVALGLYRKRIPVTS